MAWHFEIQSEPVAWLSESQEPGVRYLALRDLLGLPSDDPAFAGARREAHERGPIAAILNNMEEDGFWVKPGPGYNPKYRSTVWAITALAQLGSVGDRRRTHRAGVPLPARSRALAARTVYGHRRAFRHDRLPAGQPVRRADGPRLRGPAVGKSL